MTIKKTRGLPGCSARAGLEKLLRAHGLLVGTKTTGKNDRITGTGINKVFYLRPSLTDDDHRKEHVLMPQICEHADNMLARYCKKSQPVNGYGISCILKQLKSGHQRGTVRLKPSKQAIEKLVESDDERKRLVAINKNIASVFKRQSIHCKVVASSIKTSYWYTTKGLCRVIDAQVTYHATVVSLGHYAAVIQSCEQEINACGDAIHTIIQLKPQPAMKTKLVARLILDNHAMLASHHKRHRKARLVAKLQLLSKPLQSCRAYVTNCLPSFNKKNSHDFKQSQIIPSTA